MTPTVIGRAAFIVKTGKTEAQPAFSKRVKKIKMAMVPFILLCDEKKVKIVTVKHSFVSYPLIL